MLREEIQSLDVGSRQLHSFGITLGIALVLLPDFDRYGLIWEHKWSFSSDFGVFFAYLGPC